MPVFLSSVWGLMAGLPGFASHIKKKMYSKCKFNVKRGECLCDHPSQRLMIKCLTIIQIELDFGNVGF